MAKKKFEPGIYRHSKSGKLYYALTWGRSSEDDKQEFVIYIPLYKRKANDPPVWVRPLKMFIEKVRLGKEIVPRFKLVTPMTLFNLIEAIAKERARFQK